MDKAEFPAKPILPSYLNPKSLIVAFEEIDAQAPSYSLARPEAMRRVVYTLAITTLCLFLVEYLKHSGPFRSFVTMLEDLGVIAGGEASILRSQYAQFFAYLWWSLWQGFTLILIPILFIRIILREKTTDYGWRWGTTGAHLRGYLLLATPLSVGAVIVSFSDAFSSYYPMYWLADRSWFDLLIWELTYMPVFICVEFFFRGFMLHALRPAMGASAILVMTIPYTMIHFPKPMFESIVAFCFGILASILAYRSGSIWGGVLVHMMLAFSMDMTAIAQKGGMPDVFWPIPE